MKLDEIFGEIHKRSKQKKEPVKRVYLDRMKYDIPALKPYMFMVDELWKRTYIDEKGLTDSFKMMEDPPHLGSKKTPSFVVSRIDAARIVVSAMSMQKSAGAEGDLVDISDANGAGSDDDI